MLSVSALLRQLLRKFEDQPRPRPATLARSGSKLKRRVRKESISRPKEFRHVAHYQTRRSTIVFPELDSLDEKWEAKSQWHGHTQVQVAEVHVGPKRQYVMATPPRRKPVPSLYVTDSPTELALTPWEIPLPASPSLTASDELAESDEDLVLGHAI